MKHTHEEILNALHIIKDMCYESYGYEGETSKEDPWDDLYEGLKKRIEEQARKEVVNK